MHVGTILAVILGMATLSTGATSARADDCSQWTAAIEETEGGSEMTARICNDAGDALYIQCGGPAKLTLRFETAITDFPPGGDPDYQSEFIISIDDQHIDADMIYEAMDGDLALVFPMQGRLHSLLSQGKSMTISSKANDLPDTEFTLSGSTAAIGSVEAACRPR